MVKKQELRQRNTKNLPDSNIPGGTSFVGNIETMGGVRVDGRVKGNINAGGIITVGPEGSVEGALFAGDVNIAGVIIGDLDAKGTVQMLSGSKLVGDLSAASFAIEQGAYFKGQCLICDTKNLDTPSADKLNESKPQQAKTPAEKDNKK